MFQATHLELLNQVGVRILEWTKTVSWSVIKRNTNAGLTFADTLLAIEVAFRNDNIAALASVSVNGSLAPTIGHPAPAHSLYIKCERCFEINHKLALFHLHSSPPLRTSGAIDRSFARSANRIVWKGSSSAPISDSGTPSCC